jgi:hypothetical protein
VSVWLRRKKESRRNEHSNENFFGGGISLVLVKFKTFGEKIL